MTNPHLIQDHPGLNTVYGTAQKTPDQNWFRQSAISRSGMSVAVDGTDPSQVAHVVLHKFNADDTVDLIELEAGENGDMMAPNLAPYHDMRVKGWHKS